MNRKTAIPLALLFGLGVLLTSCGGVREIRTSYTPIELSQIITETTADTAEMNVLTYGEEDFSTYVLHNYGIEEAGVKDGAVFYEEGAGAREIAVLELADDADMDTVETALRRYIEDRTAGFYGYMPDQVYLLEQAEVIINGNYAALIICEDPQQARSAFLASFIEQREEASEPARSDAGSVPVAAEGQGAATIQNVAATPPAAISVEYDHDAILKAYDTGDKSRLSIKNRSVLEAAARIIDENIVSTMSDYEKERTIHDWMIEWAHYDIEANNQAPDARSNPENDNPYGLLIDREAICTGYAGTFQLFMDLLDIECLTVEGAAYLSTNDHAWNMVRLDGEWYCVDLTWNDPTLESDAEAWDYHMFFNVTSDYMRETEHIWDDEDTPEATGTAYGRSQPAG